MASFMIAKGFPHEEDFYNKSAWVFSFPMESPESSLLRQNITAEDQLELWRVYQEWWCEHKPSITVYVREHEWLDVGAWVYRNFNLISGVSFLPYDTGTYRQAPYESIDKGTYESLVAAMPQGVDWTEMLEVEDTTTGTKELACTAGVCEI
jgi:ribonucleoside-diphosphate reductase alpha chain